MNKKVRVSVENNTLVIVVSGKPYIFPFNKVSSKLQKATASQRENFTVSPSGYGIHWKDLDEDISIAALLKSTEKPSRKQTSRTRA